jgi:hypothetical protein
MVLFEYPAEHFAKKRSAGRLLRVVGREAEAAYERISGW